MKHMRTILLAAMAVAGFGIVGCSVSASGPYYADQQPAYIVVADAPPDTTVVEVIPESPGPSYIWVGGYYSWGGSRYVWQRGRWAVPPSGFGIWVAPTYDRNQHRYLAGHWQSRGGQPSRDTRQNVAPAADRSRATNQPAERRSDAAPPREQTEAKPQHTNAAAPSQDNNSHAARPAGKTPQPKPTDVKKQAPKPKDAPRKDDDPKDPGDAHKDAQDSK